jgi:two-component system, cell cycle sensor histidine kinase and response regulator CckA
MKHEDHSTETERLLHLILASIDDLIAVVDLDGRRLYNSPSYERILGEREKLRGTTSFGEIHPDDREMVRQVFRDTIATGIGQQIVYRLMSRDGSIRYIESHGKVINDAQGKPERVIVVGHDITDRMHAEQVREEAEDKFRNLVEQSLVGVYLMQNDTFLHVNPKFAEIFGYSAGTMMSDVPFSSIIADQERRAVLRLVEEKLVTFDETLHSTFRGRRQDGRLIDVELSGTVTDYNGAPALLGTLLDVTERKRSEEERSLLYSAIEQIGEAIIITDASGKIQYANSSFERMTGYPKAEVVGKNPRVLKSGVHETEFYAAMWATLLRGEVWSGDITNKRRDGSTYNEEMIISPVRDAGGNVVNYVAVKRDVTHEREIEDRLRQTQKMESLRQLAGGMAHDFNNIVNVILGTFSLLKGRVTPDPTTTKFLMLGEAAVRRGADMARRLSLFAQPENTTRIPLALPATINDVRNALNDAIEKTIKVETVVEPDLPQTIAHAGQLYQSILTLCINARDAIAATRKEDGTIRLGAGIVDGRSVHAMFPEAGASRYIRVTVGDNGIGMTEEKRRRIFEPFVSAEQAEGGRGFGLAMVYGIVSSHGGFVDVESEPGRGTTFSLYFPAVHAETPQPVAAPGTVTRGGSETILVVEDEEAILLLLGEVLRSRGYEVLTAHDGVEGFEVYRDHVKEIDAVITDMGLPRMSGFDMFQKIRGLNPKAKVILASGYLNPELKSKLFVAGAKAFIPKPFEIADVLVKLRETLDMQT